MEESTPKAQDVLWLHSATEDGEGMRVLRARGEGVQVGEVRPLKEGQALLGGEVVSLHPREGTPRLCDVEVVHRVPEAVASRSGPAQIASHAYRESWDRVFGTGQVGTDTVN